MQNAVSNSVPSHSALSGSALSVLDTRRGLLLAGSDEALYRAFLLDYPQDDTVPRLRAALNAGRMEEAALLAHTLKGLAAQLGMDEVADAAHALQEAIRAGEPAAACERRVLRAHRRAVRAIAHLSEGFLPEREP